MHRLLQISTMLTIKNKYKWYKFASIYVSVSLGLRSGIPFFFQYVWFQRYVILSSYKNLIIGWVHMDITDCWIELVC